MKPVRTLDAELRTQLAAEAERRLSAEDLDARINVPMSAFEEEDFTGLVTWFRRRYPTPGDRIRYIRRRMLQLRQRTK